MKIYYDNSGKIVNAIFDADMIKQPAEDEALNIFEIDEIAENHAICSEISVSIANFGLGGLSRWHVENGNLYSNDAWELPV